MWKFKAPNSITSQCRSKPKRLFPNTMNVQDVLTQGNFADDQGKEFEEVHKATTRNDELDVDVAIF